MTAHSYILPAKLDSPRLGVKTLTRTRLCEQLDKSLERDVTIVVAPAGFGKSVLLADWMTHAYTSHGLAVTRCERQSAADFCALSGVVH